VKGEIRGDFAESAWRTLSSCSTQTKANEGYSKHRRDIADDPEEFRRWK
jgi:hypothetical protein